MGDRPRKLAQALSTARAHARELWRIPEPLWPKPQDDATTLATKTQDVAAVGPLNELITDPRLPIARSPQAATFWRRASAAIAACAPSAGDQRCTFAASVGYRTCRPRSLPNFTPA